MRAPGGGTTAGRRGRAGRCRAVAPAALEKAKAAGAGAREALAGGEGLAQWEAAAAALQERLGVEGAVADAYLSLGFAWENRKYWRTNRENAVPSPAEVEAVFRFLADDLQLSAEEQTKVVADFPEVVGLSPELMAQNMEFLAKNFFMKGPIAVKTVKRNPVVLGNMLDCTRESGACEGDCNRCWARF